MCHLSYCQVARSYEIGHSCKSVTADVRSHNVGLGAGMSAFSLRLADGDCEALQARGCPCQPARWR